MTADLQFTLTRWARTLDPSPETVERIWDRVADRMVAPSKASAILRYGQAVADLAAIKDWASDDFLFSKAYRDHARAAAISAGATLAEIRDAEREARS